MGRLVPLALILLSLPASALRAGQWFVAPGGSDAGPGTAAQPFATVQRGADAAVAGDTVTVRAGLYVYAGAPDGMAVTLSKAGSPASGRITIAAETPGAAVLDGGGLAHSYFNLTSSAAFVTLRGFEIRNTRWSGVWANGTAAKDIVVQGNAIHDIGARTETASLGIAGIFANAAASDWTIDGNAIYAVGRSSGAMTGALDHGLYIAGGSFTVRDNVFSRLRNGWHIQLADGFSGRIANNTFFGPDPAGSQPGQIVLWNRSANLEIKNNLFYGPRDYAVHTLTASVSGACQLQNNLAFSTAGAVALIAAPPAGCVQSGNILNADPRALSPDEGPRLAPGGPAQDAGLALPYVPADFYGAPRPQGPAYDIGAYEAVYATATLFTTQAPGSSNFSPGAGSIELGVRLKADLDGQVTAIRFYKINANAAGPHTGHLWSSGGALLGSASFSGETASGWQTAVFAKPIPVYSTAAYVASYHTPGGYPVTRSYFVSQFNHAPLHALADASSAHDGGYQYGAGAVFPNQGVSASNYWVDAVFSYSTGTAVSSTTLNPAPSIASLSPSSVTAGGPGLTLTVLGSGFVSTSTVLWNGVGRPTTFAGATALTIALSSAEVAEAGVSQVAVFTAPPGGGLSAGLPFTVAASTAAPPPPPPPPSPPPAVSTATLFGAAAPASNQWSADSKSVELGVRFRSDLPGQATALRFYKQPSMKGAHAGHLWTSSGTLLGSVTFTGESASGWQTASFSSPVPISSGFVYLASFHAAGGYAATRNYFASAGVDHPPLHASKDSAGAPDGAYIYSAAPAFPTQGHLSTNFWADLVVSYSSGPAPGPAPNPAPSLLSLSPSTATAGDAGLALQVLGSGFVSTSTVLWNGSARPTAFVDTGTLTAQLSAADLAAGAFDSVSVFTALPGGGLSSSGTFTVFNPSPTIAALDPGTATAGGPAFSLRVLGAGFVPGSTALWNGSARTTAYLSSAALSVSIAPADLASSGTASVAVLNGPPGGGLSDPASLPIAQAPDVSTGPWTAAYYTGWLASRQPIDQVDLGAVDAIIHFSVQPKADGTLDRASNSLSTAAVAAVVATVHAAGKKVLFSCGGWQTESAFASAMSSTHQASFISSLVGFMTQGGYDGIDLDMEPIAASEVSSYVAFVKALRARLDQVQPGSMITAAVDWQPQAFAQLTNEIDHMNLLSYSLSGTYLGQTWHESPVYSPASTSTLRSLDSMVRAYLAAGVPAEKLGGGVTFDAYVWTGGSGVTGPQQKWTSAPAATEVVYSTVADQYGLSESSPAAHPLYRWDAVAQSPYLSVPGSPPSTSKFISLNDASSIQEKYRYARAQGLGAMILWDVQAAYRPQLPPGQRDGLLQAVKAARLGPPPLNPSPLLSSLDPASASPGGPAFTLTASGAGFTPASVVRWNGSARPTAFVDQATLTARIAAADIAAAGSAAVTVFTPAPAGGESAASVFSIAAVMSPAAAALNPAPALEGVSLARAAGAGVEVGVTGAGFVRPSRVCWNGAPLPTTFVSGSALLGTLSAGAAVEGPGLVTVKNPEPGGGVSNGSTVTAAGFLGCPPPAPRRQDPVAVLSRGVFVFSPLAQDSAVEIFTTRGQLVRSVPAARGQAVWDLTDDAGRRAAPGRYLYTAVAPDGRRGGGTVTVPVKL